MTYERVMSIFAIVAIISYSVHDLWYPKNYYVPSTTTPSPADLLSMNKNEDTFEKGNKTQPLAGGGPMIYVAEDNNNMFQPKPIQVPPKVEKDDLVYSNRMNTVPIVNEEFKVIFFQVAKAASSEWIRFFSRLDNNPNWCYDGSIHDDSISGVKRLSDYTRDEASQMMVDPSWTKAMFVRNPKSRILSAYLDKAVAHSKKFKKQQCRTYARKGGLYEDCVERHTDFDFFVHNIITTWDNVHWMPIYERIDEKWWPYMSFVSNMENLSHDTELFLKSIHSTVNGESAWERSGKTGWSENVRDCDVVGKDAFLAVKDKDHHTNAEDKFKRYYTPDLERFIERYYWKDYSNPYYHFSPLKIFPNIATQPAGKP